MIGCAHQKPTLVAETAVEPTFHNGHEILQLQDEIKQLQELIKEKDALIRQQHAHQQSQDKEQQEASSEVTRVQTRLHRLATKSSAASTIAEVEVAMEILKQEQTIISDQTLHQQAQSLLDAALLSYKQGEYVVAMNYASQAHEFINMVADQNRKASYYNRKTVPIYISLRLKAMTDVNLRENPHNNARILNILEKDSILVANAYRGNWFRVQTDGGLQGWVSNTLVSTVEDKPKEIVQE